MLSIFIYGIETLKNNKMIKPEIDLELSINALKVYGIEPNIIKSMLSNLQKIVNKNCNIPNVNGLACKCGNQTFTHRHSNWIECTACNKIQILQDCR